MAQQQTAAWPHAHNWDGHNAAGQTVAAGQYFTRLQTPDGSSVQKIMLTK